MAAAAMKHMASIFAKLEKFEGVDFRRWQKKMHFMLSSMSVMYVLTTPMPEDGGDQLWSKSGRGPSGTMMIIHLRIEESLRVQESDKTKGNNVAGPSVVNMVEHNNSSRVWGCRAAVRLPDIKLKTLVTINYITESRDAIFDKNMFSSVPRLSQRSLVQGMRSLTNTSIALMLRMTPKTFDEAMKSQDVAFWKKAINDEMDSIMGNNTWVLTDLPPGCRPLGCKWIFKRKSKVDGTVEKFKARELEEEVYMNQPLGFIMPGNENKVDLTKEFLSSRFSMKDMEEADVILGIRIKHESNGIEISQPYYIEKVLKKFNYSDCTPVSTHLDTFEKLMHNRGLAVSQLEYSKVIGCLMYAMTCTRPDIVFDVRKLNYGYPSVLEGYTDASWISNTENNSSISGWVFLLGGGAISWASKKQTCITGSTTEYEFVALAAAGKEAEWLKNLLPEIPLHSMIRELITNEVISIEFVRSQQNLDDHLMKGLSRDLVIKSAKGMRLKSN
nr:zinc finger, CCHC-type [Tanacetum cinerariifolium]